jgi:uncharacterized membrane protein
MKILNKKINSLKRSNLKGLWCYALGWISGIFFLITAWENKFIRFHAIQSTLLFGFMTLVGIISMNIANNGWILGLFIAMLSLVLWKWLMWEAYSGEMVRLPLIGQLAGRLANMVSMEKLASPMAVRLQK